MAWCLVVYFWFFFPKIQLTVLIWLLCLKIPSAVSPVFLAEKKNGLS